MSASVVLLRLEKQANTPVWEAPQPDLEAGYRRRSTAARIAAARSSGRMNWGQCPVGRSTHSTVDVLAQTDAGAHRGHGFKAGEGERMHVVTRRGERRRDPGP